AYAARAGLRSLVFIPAGLEPGKVGAASAYGATVVEVNGTYDDVNRLCVELADLYGWAIVNVNLRPFYSEGSKTLAFEVVEQLGCGPGCDGAARANGGHPERARRRRRRCRARGAGGQRAHPARGDGRDLHHRQRPQNHRTLRGP